VSEFREMSKETLNTNFSLKIKYIGLNTNIVPLPPTEQITFEDIIFYQIRTTLAINNFLFFRFLLHNTRKYEDYIKNDIFSL